MSWISAGLAGGVGRAAADADLAELRGDVDDGAAAGLADFRHRVFAHQERAGEVDGERVVPVVERERLDRAVRRHGGGDIDQRGELAEGFDGVAHRALCVLCDRDIGADGDGLPACGGDLAATIASRAGIATLRRLGEAAAMRRRSRRRRRRSARRAECAPPISRPTSRPVISRRRAPVRARSLPSATPSARSSRSRSRGWLSLSNCQRTTPSHLPPNTSVRKRCCAAQPASASVLR